MHRLAWRGVVALPVVFTLACTSAMSSSGSTGVQPANAGQPILTPAAQAAADSGRPRYTRADVEFMQGMIRHHAQALVMAAWAPSHAARSDVKTLAARIDVAQRDEIALMERWLRERREAVPDAHAHANMPGHQMELMPGMLTVEQVTQLDKARGPEFDRLFLTFMIQHHEGALAMLERLFATPGAGQDPVIFRFASDVEADQTTEIDRMRSMLAPQPNQP